MSVSPAARKSKLLSAALNVKPIEPKPETNVKPIEPETETVPVLSVSASVSVLALVSAEI